MKNRYGKRPAKGKKKKKVFPAKVIDYYHSDYINLLSNLQLECAEENVG